MITTSDVCYSTNGGVDMCADYCTAVAVGAGPAWIADTLPRFEAVAVVASRLRQTFVTVDTRPTLSASAATLTSSLYSTLHLILH